jgi:hypothetical protein
MKLATVAGVVAVLAAGTAWSADVLAQGRTPDTTMPGSTSPGYVKPARPAYSTREERYFAAELRKCEAVGDPTERLACKSSVRDRFGEM